MAAVRRASPAFFDTSVFVAGLLEIGDDAATSQQALAAAVEGRTRPLTAWHCCLEFYSVCTRLPEAYRLDPLDALRIIEEVIVRGFAIHDLPAARRLDFLRGAAAESVRGGRLYDAHLASVADAHGALAVVTANPRHFAPLLRRGVRVLTAAQWLGGA